MMTRIENTTTSSTFPVEVYDQETDENGTTQFVRR